MTINYSTQCATTGIGTFARLLFRWKGSIYKLVYQELFFFMAIYYAINFVYRFALDGTAKDRFEKLCLFCSKNADTYIPLIFIMGFYVSQIYSRWWCQYQAIMWPDRFALEVATFVKGDDQRGRLLRRTLVRYLNSAFIICLRDIGSAVRKRFPTWKHVVDAGFLTDEEAGMVEATKSSPQKYWIPLQWCLTLLNKIRKEGRLADGDFSSLLGELLDCRNKLQGLCDYDWINVPISYTQVVTIAVYTYFLAALFGRQLLDPAKNLPGSEIDFYFPFLTVLQFIFYVGWLKVAETLLNPFGEDDDDFEVNYLIDRNLQVSYVQVTENYDRLPTIERDIHWNDKEVDIPNTAASAGLKDNGFAGSAADIEVTPVEAQIVEPNTEPQPGLLTRLISRVGDVTSNRTSVAPSRSSPRSDTATTPTAPQRGPSLQRKATTSLLQTVIENLSEISEEAEAKDTMEQQLIKERFAKPDDLKKY